MGTLWINLKISEKDELEDHHDEKEDVMEFGVTDEDEDIKVEIPKNDDDDKRRICHVCNKGFGSGKALGGHMRIHVQPSKKQLFSGKKDKKSKTREQVYLENCNNDQLLPTCSMCGKNFPSMKSLFGHMRCHPERAWRGIHPPHLKSIDEIHIKKAKKTASATTTTTVTVPGWSVTAKRGRKPNAEEEATNSVSKDEEQLQDAVHHLMLLANGDSIESGVTRHDTPEELEKTNSNSLTSKAETVEFHASESKIADNRKRRKKKMKLRHLNSVGPASVMAATPEKYKCNTCGKSFATHQALGGHKSSHNKFRLVIQNSDVTNVAATSEEAAAISSKLADSKLSSQLNSPGCRILDFDLNELPPDHEAELSGNHEYFPFFPI
ncbi:zinc finger protein ZAT9-like [Solanum dulcamara]|uniref:zinc finger protein ZAT9-like n=1 Tax=Solanum dulcamara TaxID=45834 RepID=UPI0024852046|nr:zinc finger protein ZAT9-like [Solanum dulcamara]